MLKWWRKYRAKRLRRNQPAVTIGENALNESHAGFYTNTGIGHNALNYDTECIKAEGKEPNMTVEEGI